MTKGIALVTGAAKRIGREISLHLAQRGWNIAIHYKSSKTQALDLSQEIQSMGQKSFLIQADLNSEFKAPEIFKKIENHFKEKTSLLINNASVFLEDDINSISKESFENHLRTNLWAPIALTQSFSKNSGKGNIINIIDQRVLNPKPNFLSYGLSKSSLLTFTQMMAQELAPKIRVNAIGPGPILKSIHQTDEDFKSEVESLPLKTPPNPEDINRAISFILSTPSMTGQFITLDGGQHLS